MICGYHSNTNTKITGMQKLNRACQFQGAMLREKTHLGSRCIICIQISLHGSIKEPWKHKSRDIFKSSKCKLRPLYSDTNLPKHMCLIKPSLDDIQLIYPSITGAL